MKTDIQNTEKNTVKLTIELSQDEFKKYLEEAAREISQKSEIQGFRPGKASLEAVANRVGEMSLYEQAAEPAVKATLFQALHENKIENVGQPSINIEKLAPNNPFVYTAEVALMPKVAKLADYKKLKVQAKKVVVKDKDVDQALEQLKRMQTKEVRSKEPATKEDKVVVDLSMEKDKVPVEGGEGLAHAVYLSEDHYIPGFCNKLIGAKEGDEKKFTLKFPEEHYQKHLAGCDIDFKVKIKEIYELQHPEVNDKFAESLGQKSLDELKKLIKQNITAEKEQAELAKQEKEALELLANKSDFEEIPDILVNEELHKMIHELEHSISQQGLKIDDYLKQIGKDMNELKLDFTPQALMRIKVAIITKEISEQEKIKISEDAIDKELDQIASHYEEGTDERKRIYSPVYRDYTAYILKNRAVIRLITEAMIQK